MLDESRSAAAGAALGSTMVALVSLDDPAFSPAEEAQTLESPWRD